MAFSDSLLRTVNSLLRKFDATDRPVYKRLITKTGGDPLLGRPGAVSYVDTLLDPQPAVEVVSESMLSMGVTISSLAQIGDYRLLSSGSALSRADLQNSAIVLLFKDGSAVEELIIVTFAPLAVTGADVAFEILARSKKR